MKLFGSLCDFLQRRQATKLDAGANGLQLVVERSESLRGHFVFPGQAITATVRRDGQPVGSISYGLSPLGDRVYISEFKIRSDQHRRGHGQAALWQLWRLYQVPLTPMHEVGTSTGFWAKARTRFAAAGAELTVDIRTGDQPGEKARWAHLVPEPEHERLVREYYEWVEAERAAGREAGHGYT